MYKITSRILSGISILFIVSTTANAEVGLRLYCEGPDEGAKIYANGIHKGECPVTFFMPAGNIKLRVVKIVDSEYERVYENDFNLVDGAVKKIEVTLSGPQLSASAIKERKRKKEQQEKETANTALSKAKKGDIEAMKAIALYYEKGTGVIQNSKEASYWDRQATLAEDRALVASTLKNAEAGEFSAMQDMARFYDEGKVVKKDKNKAKLWQNKADDALAKNALESAETGNIDSMKQISRYYAEGKGVKKNLVESDLWKNKAEIAEAEKYKRDKQARINSRAQAEMDQIDFLLYTKGTWSMAGNIEKDTPDPAARSTSYTMIPSMTLFGMAMDLTSAPTNSTEMAQLKTEMASRPATFGKPDSMIAMAYKNNLVVQR